MNGHTDAKGSEGYNQELSERRAAAVVTYLAQYHKVDVSYLKAIGYGETQLKDPAYPEDALNRRVEIVNLILTSQTELCASFPLPLVGRGLGVGGAAKREFRSAPPPPRPSPQGQGNRI